MGSKGVSSVHLGPKFRRHRQGPGLPRPFIDREELIHAFWDEVHRRNISGPNMLIHAALV
jgi:hypothetical protein